MVDAREFAEEEREVWNSVSAAWRKWWGILETSAQPLNDRLVALAGVAPGHAVLDIATGIGEPAVTAAHAAGPEGRVLATDLAPEMLAIAGERARAAGLDQVEFVAVDAHDLAVPPGSFDAAVCRWGLMHMLDPVAVARNVRAALRPGGRGVFAVWGPPEDVPFLEVPLSVLRRELGAPALDLAAPGPFRLAAPEQLRAVLLDAGFDGVRVEESVVTMSFASGAQFVEFVSELSSRIRRALSEHPGAAGDRIRAQIAHEADRHRGPEGGVAFENRVLCAVGAR